jgi:hypothetical protein
MEQPTRRSKVSYRLPRPTISRIQKLVNDLNKGRPTWQKKVSQADVVALAVESYR